MRIRKNIGLVIGAIGLSTVGFLFTDAVNSSSGMFANDPASEAIGSINGTEISRSDYEQRVNDYNTIYEIYTNQQVPAEQAFQNRNQAWNQIVRSTIIKPEIEGAGFTASSDEVLSLMTGSTPAPQARALYTTLTGKPQNQFNPQELATLIARVESDPTIDPRAVAAVNAVKSDIATSREQQKFFNLLRKSNAVPTWKAKQEFNRTNTNTTFSYINIPASSISDEEISLSDADINAYIKANPAKFKKSATVDFQLVNVDIIPSKEDTAATVNWLSERKARMADTTNSIDSTFIANATRNTPFFYSGRFQTKEDLALSSKVDAFFESEEESFVGPYKENENYILAKVKEKAMIADSANYAYLIVRSDSTLPSGANLADSIEGLVKGGADIATLAQQYSLERGSVPQVGEFKWVNHSANENPINNNGIFSDIFINGKAGMIKRWDLNFGTPISVILSLQELGPKTEAAKVMMLAREIKPGERTKDEAYKIASEVYAEVSAGNSIEEVANAKGLVPRIANAITPEQANLPSYTVPVRNIVEFGFNNEAGTAKMFQEYSISERKYIVAQVANKKAYGLPTAGQLTASQRSEIIREKKLEALTSKVTSAKSAAADLNALATALETNVNTVDQPVAVTAQFVPGIGNEPAVLGAAAGLESGEMSDVVQGKLGVFVIQGGSTTMSASEATFNANVSRSPILNKVNTKFDYNLLNVMTGNAEVKDERYK